MGSSIGRGLNPNDDETCIQVLGVSQQLNGMRNYEGLQVEAQARPQGHADGPHHVESDT